MALGHTKVNMGRTLTEAMDALSADRRAGVEARAAELIAEE